jgi:tRNA-dihydrouridine synthase B
VDSLEIPGYSIRNLKVEPGLVLAPMSGVTTGAFRRLIKELNPGAVGLTISEFISVEAMTRQVPRSLKMMNFAEIERPFGIQIFGYDIKRMHDAALMVQDAGADLLDINCGCPAPKVVRKGGGCELMRQPDHLTQILRTVRKAVSIPFTIKMRSGWDQGCLNAPEICRIAESEGVEGVAVHGRTRAQLYRGLADWEVVKAVREQVKIPVFGSGDVVDLSSASERLKSGCSALFIGRGALANPLVFSEIATGTKKSLRNNPALVATILLRYIELLREEFTDKGVIGKSKQLASQMCAGYSWKREFLRMLLVDQQVEFLRRLQDQQLTGSIDTMTQITDEKRVTQ